MEQQPAIGNIADSGTEGQTRGVGGLIASRRQARGWSLARLAAEVGCAKSYLSDLENDRRTASDDVLSRLETALECEPGSLLDRARWERALDSGGATVAREVSRLREQSDAAQHLVSLLKMHAGSLDEAYRSGALAALIARVGSPEGTAGADEAEFHLRARGTPGAKGEGREDHGGAPTDTGCAGGAAGAASNTGVTGGAGATGARVVSRALAAALPREVPLINKVAAGYPREFTDLSYPARMADDYVRCPDIADPDAFAARVVGDSMEPEYREGDIVVFSPARAIKDGDDCFARLELDGETTFKRIYFQKDGAGAEYIRLQPINNKYPPRTLAREEVAGLYAAVTAIRRIGG